MKTARFVVAALFFSSAAMAQDKAIGPLPPGNPAGVRQADGATEEVPWLIVTAVVSLAGGLLLFKGTTAATTPVATTTS